MFRGSVRVNLCRYVTPKFSIFLFNQADYFNKYKNLLGYFCSFCDCINSGKAGRNIICFFSAPRGIKVKKRGSFFRWTVQGEVDPKAVKAKKA